MKPKNPWHIQSLYELQYFNCLSCSYKNKSKQDIVNHVYDLHPEAIDALNNISDGSTENLDLPWRLKEFKVELFENPSPQQGDEQQSDHDDDIKYYETSDQEIFDFTSKSHNANDNNKDLYKVRVELSPMKRNSYCFICDQYYCTKSVYQNHMKNKHTGLSITINKAKEENNEAGVDKSEDIFPPQKHEFDEKNTSHEFGKTIVPFPLIFDTKKSELKFKSSININTKAANEENVEEFTDQYDQEITDNYDQEITDQFDQEDTNDNENITTNNGNEESISDNNFKPLTKLVKNKVTTKKYKTNLKYDKNFVKLHMISDNPKKYKCSLCDFSPNHSSNLKRHYHAMHVKNRDKKFKEIEKTFQCHECGKIETYIGKSDGKIRTKCTDCKKLQKLNKEKQRYKEMILKGERNFKCEKCPMTFHKGQNLEIHIKTVHEKLRPNMCDLCGKAFFRASYLKLHHKTVHEGHRDIRCELCGKSFVGGETKLKSHIRTVHEKQRNFICNACGKAFAQKSSLQTHQKGYCKILKQLT